MQKATTGEEKKESDECGDLRDQLKSEQKPGVSFPHDSCSSKNLTPELKAVALTQCTLKKGLKEFGDDGRTPLGKEIEQLRARRASKPVDGDNLTREQKRAFLRHLMFLTKKRCGRIKARGCADGRKQRETTSKEEASAPTASIEAVMTSAVIDALEGRDMATVNMPGAFMQADIDEIVHVKFEGETAEMLVKLESKLQNRPVRGASQSPAWNAQGSIAALEDTIKTTGVMGIRDQPMRLVPSEQDDRRQTAHNRVARQPEAVTAMTKLIDSEFGKESPIAVTRGKVHDCLGVTLDCSAEGKVMIKALDSVAKMLAELPEELLTEKPQHLQDVI